MENFDVVMPNKNEEELIAMALKLGYKQLIFLVTDINYSSKSDKIRIKTAYLLKDISEFHRAKKSFDLIFANAERRFFEQKVDYILNAEWSDRRDSFHYRNTSLNQVHAKLVSANETSIIFNFGLLLNSENSRAKYLGRMFQNALLSRKYNLKYSVFSMAKNPLEMRSRTILDALARVLGL